MRSRDSRQASAKQLLTGVEYLADLLNWYEQIPHGRIDGFCERRKAPIGASRIYFLIGEAEKLEEKVILLEEQLDAWAGDNRR